MKNRWPNKPKEQYHLFGPDPSGFEVLFEENLPSISLRDLLAKFYYHNHFDTTPVRPISSHLEGGSSEREAGWWFMYHWRFFVHIERHYESSHGPHIMRLRYKAQCAQRVHWVATLQLEAFYFQEEAILPHLYVAIRDRKFFQTETDAKRIVVL